MKLRNILTHKEIDLPEDTAKRWVTSCSPWYSDEWAPEQGREAVNYNLDNIDPDAIHEFWNHCLSCTRSILCARMLAEILQQAPHSSDAWVIMKNNCYAIAVLEWTKAFGSDSEEYHWKKVFGADSGFIQGIWGELGLEEKAYQDYRQKMMDIRVSWVAHKGLPKNPNPPLPDFDLAIDIFQATHKLLVPLLEDLTKHRRAGIYNLEPMSFEVWMDNIQSDLDNTLKQAIL